MEDQIRKLCEALNKAGRALSPKEAARAAGIFDEQQLAQLVQRLENEGRLLVTKQGNLISPEEAGMVKAQITSRSARFSFARPVSGGDNIYIDNDRIKGAMPGDVVFITNLRQRAKGPAGEVARVIEAGAHEYTGRVVRARGKKEYELETDEGLRFSVPLCLRKGEKLKAGTKILAQVTGTGKKTGTARCCQKDIWKQRKRTRLCGRNSGCKRYSHRVPAAGA